MMNYLLVADGGALGSMARHKPRVGVSC